jgi:hypothetical protein
MLTRTAMQRASRAPSYCLQFATSAHANWCITKSRHNIPIPPEEIIVMREEVAHSIDGMCVSRLRVPGQS